MAIAMPEGELEWEPENPAERRPNGHRSFAVIASRVRARIVFMVLDSLCVLVGFGLAEVIYFRNRPPSYYWQHFSLFLLAALTVALVTNQLLGLYGRMWRHAGVEEARQLGASAIAIATVLLCIDLIVRATGYQLVPLSVAVVGTLFASVGMAVLRFHSRLFAWQRGSRRVGLRVAVVGSRDTGASAVREMLRCPGAGLVPVAVFDDDSRAHGLSLLGVPVVGGIEDIPAATSRFSLQQVLLAIPDPPPALVEKVLRASEKAELQMKVLPGVHDAPTGQAHLAAIRQAREPRIEDLLGRTEVETDLASVRRSLAGHRVLVTGAGGSIGSEISRQVAELEPEELILLDHDETHLHDTAATIHRPCHQALVDIADRACVFATFERHRPQVVFHAAAHKHVPILEKHPIEASKTNVFGTLNVVDAAVEVGAERFVLISSDKAVRPSSVMGASKCLAEQIVLARFPEGRSYCAVRFGNVLGSRGSVIPTFARQIANGGPVTVTDPGMTRFFMSVEESVQLVLQSSVLSTGGEIFMLEMGEPIKIIELAERMIQLSGYRVGEDIPIHIVGSRPGEKLAEDLRTDAEQVLETEHPSIHRVLPASVPPQVFTAQLEELSVATARRKEDEVRALLFAAVSTAHDQADELGDPATFSPAGDADSVLA